MKSVDVSTIPNAHPNIRAYDWVAALVCRLHSTREYRDGNKILRFSIRPPGGSEGEECCDFWWNKMKDDFEKTHRTYQSPVITEFATLALACASVEIFAGLVVREVTRRRERADFWLGDGELLLEVSGQQTGNLEKLRERKARQLRQNPHGKDGYVCVADYTSGSAQFWYYEYDNRA